jgi:predicted esterase
MNMCLVLVCAVLFMPLIIKGQQTAYVSPAGTKFLLYLPPSYSTGTQQHPLLISLHGSGQGRDDLTLLTNSTASEMPARLIAANKWSQDLPFIVVSPQYIIPDLTNPRPVWPVEHIDEVVNYVMANFRVQKKKVYVTGLSMGGFATWNYAAAYPGKVAAIVPIAARNDLTKACFYNPIPAWLFHGDNDPTVNVAYSIDIINAIKNCVPAASTPKLNILYTENHYGWNEVYNGTHGYKIYDWLLKFTKGSLSNTKPYVNAGPDITVHLSNKSLFITGDAFDTDGSLTNITWKKLSGPGLSLSNLNAETFKINTLVPGTYEFQLSATDNSGAWVADRMILKVVDTSTLPVVTQLFLVNGSTNADVMEITNDLVVDKNLLQLSHINIRAVASTSAKSVRFSVNTNRNTRTLSSPGPYLIRSPSSGTEWDVETGEYVICATPYTSTSGGGTAGVARCLKIRVIEGVPSSQCTGAGNLYREVWAGITGTSISSIPVSTPPNVKTLLYRFESPTDVGDNYGARLRGYLCPPLSGSYTFWISSNDRSELWLSTDSNPANKRKVAYVNTFTNIRQWTNVATQQSLPIQLSGGQKYYVEALHKEGIDLDHLAVGWRLPNSIYERPIPGFRILPFETVSASQASDEAVNVFNAISISPNPIGSNGEITISGFGAEQGEEVMINIFSITGSALLQKTTTMASTTLILPLENQLATGIYLITVKSARHKMTRRIIIHP